MGDSDCRNLFRRKNYREGGLASPAACPNLPPVVMAVPKRKSSNSRSGKRCSHNALKPRQLTYCAKCSTALPTHVVCPNCGYYMGRVVVESDEA